MSATDILLMASSMTADGPSAAGAAMLSGPGLVPDAADVARFRSMLAQSVAASDPATPVAGRLLASVTVFEQEQADKLGRIESLVANDDAGMSTMNLLAAQQQLLETVITYDLAGKVITRTTQNIDQLVHLQ